MYQPVTCGDPGAVTVSLILARGRNGVIGVGGGLPWRLAGDLAWFKSMTLGKPLLMGRKTWESLPRKPLPHRPALVLSRTASGPLAGAWVFASLDTARAAATAMAIARGVDEIFVIGGAALYQQCLDLADRLYLTEVEAAPAGDVFAPVIGAEWMPIGRTTSYPADERNSAAFTTQILERAPRPAGPAPPEGL